MSHTQLLETLEDIGVRGTGTIIKFADDTVKKVRSDMAQIIDWFNHKQ